EAAYQRCYVHFLRNALDHVPRRVDDDCLQELRWLYDRRDLIEARRDLAAWLVKWSSKYSKLTGWVEDNIDETLTFYQLSRQHHKHLKSTKDARSSSHSSFRRNGSAAARMSLRSSMCSVGCARGWVSQQADTNRKVGCLQAVEQQSLEWRRRAQGGGGEVSPAP